jgi:hypothetical protein
LDSLEEDDEDAVDEDTATTDTPVFSLHAVAGVSTNNSLLLRVTLGQPPSLRWWTHAPPTVSSRRR